LRHIRFTCVRRTGGSLQVKTVLLKDIIKIYSVAWPIAPRLSDGDIDAKL
jgi:hypothetical protein